MPWPTSRVDDAVRARSTAAEAARKDERENSFVSIVHYKRRASRRSSSPQLFFLPSFFVLDHQGTTPSRC